MLEELKKEKNYPKVGPYAVILLCELLKKVKFSAKKTIIKLFFMKNLIPIIHKNHLFIFLFLTFFISITDKTVFTITAGKSIKKNLTALPLVENKTVQHLLYLITCKDISNLRAIDKSLCINDALVEFVDLEGMSKSNLFVQNVDHFLSSIFSTLDLIPKPSQIIEHCSQNQNFSALMGAMLERNLKSYLISREAGRLQQESV